MSCFLITKLKSISSFDNRLETENLHKTIYIHAITVKDIAVIFG